MRFRIFLLFLNFSISAFSQENAQLPIAPNIDSLVTEYQVFSADSLLQNQPFSENEIYSKKFRDQFQSKYKKPDFDYFTVKPEESFWQKISKRIQQLLESVFGKLDPQKAGRWTIMILRLFGIVLVALLLYFVTNLILKNDGKFFFRRKNSKVHYVGEDLIENIHEINFPDAIANFERTKEFRSAVRYQFLFVLKKLADQKLIFWNAEKTNNDYASELKSIKLKNDFKDVAYLFDYVWYGDFEVNEARYQNYKQKFSAFKINHLK